MSYGAKQLVIEKIESLMFPDKNLRILDLGSGQSKNFLSFLKKYPNTFYTGIEPNKKDADRASELLYDFPNAKIYNRSGYEIIDDLGEFDICISLSVLEHIKQLDKFLENSVKNVRSGGQIIHFYDLGHALYPTSLKEMIQVFLGNNFPKILPENKFVRYVDEENVKKILTKAGAEIKKVSYHQMPNLKKLFSLLSKKVSFIEEEIKEIEREFFLGEFKISKFLSSLNKKEKEKLFSSICIWAVKK